MKPIPPWGKPVMAPYVDLIVLRNGKSVDMYARNSQGLHVPISTLSAQQTEDAYALWGVLGEGTLPTRRKVA